MSLRRESELCEFERIIQKDGELVAQFSKDVDIEHPEKIGKFYVPVTLMAKRLHHLEDDCGIEEADETRKACDVYENLRNLCGEGDILQCKLPLPYFE